MILEKLWRPGNVLLPEERILTTQFDEWRGAITKYIDKTGARMHGHKYKFSKIGDIELLKAVREHASTYSKPLRAPNIITLTHPAYALLSHPTKITTREQIHTMQEYCSTLTRLLTRDIPRDIANIVLFETPQHYAAATSILLEEGLVDGALFTTFDNGELLDDSLLNEHRKKRFFPGGAYSAQCYRSSLQVLQSKVKRTKRIHPVLDLIINHPDASSNRLKTVHEDIVGCYNRVVPKKRILLLDEMFEMLEV